MNAAAEPSAQPCRDDDLTAWIRAAGGCPESLAAMPGDVSARRYHRLETVAGGTAVLALYPPAVTDVCRRFLATTRLLETAGVPVPRVRAHDCDRGWMLLEDLGRETLYHRAGRPWEELAPWFEAAVDLAQRISRLPPAEVEALSPPLDRPLLRRELAQTWECFLEPRALTGTGPFRRRLEGLLDELCQRLGEAPTIPCHRDFMARNLVPWNGDPKMEVAPEGGREPRAGRPGADGAEGEAGPVLIVLDHQDLRPGPPWYDLASLLNDSLFPPPALEERLLARALPAGDEARLAYHRAAAQRTLKAVGTFAAFARRGCDRHLPLIPPTLARSLGHLARLPEAREIYPDLTRRWRAAAGDMDHRT